MEALSRARVIGGSVVVTIPKEVVRAEQIHEGELLQVDFKKIKRDFFGVLRGVGPFTTGDEMKAHD